MLKAEPIERGTFLPVAPCVARTSSAFAITFDDESISSLVAVDDEFTG